MADGVYSWLCTHLRDASRAPQIVREGRTLSPVQGFDQGGMIVVIYRDAAGFYAEIGGNSLGFFQHADWDVVVREFSARYAATLGAT